MQTYITHLLSPYCDVETAVNGRRGWEALQRAEYDLVISDWMMPDMNGPELLDAIRNNNRMKDMPFIMLTARSGDESRLSGLLAGADGN
jgi:DNA-binding response OmpR family regulator